MTALEIEKYECLHLVEIYRFIGLYYITYYVAGWDLGEPIAYLLGVMVEITGRLQFTQRYYISSGGDKMLVRKC